MNERGFPPFRAQQAQGVPPTLLARADEVDRIKAADVELESGLFRYANCNTIKLSHDAIRRTVFGRPPCRQRGSVYTCRAMIGCQSGHR